MTRPKPPETPATAPPSNSAPPVTTAPLSEITRAFLKIGVLSFGGPAAQISLMHRVLVTEKRWLAEKQYLNALSFCMLLPGPEAMQLATYSGWRLRGLIGGLIGGLLFVLPGAFVIFALATIYALYGDQPMIKTLFLGIKAAVLIIVLQALLRLATKALKHLDHWIIAAAAFAGIFLFALPFPLIVLLAALYGFFFGSKPPETSTGSPVIETSVWGTLRTIAIWLCIWLLPILVIEPVTGHAILGSVGAFFSKLAVVTFGGAYAVLAYMAQDVVTQLGWLSAGEMMDALGLAETTPGPLILVTQFVGFLAGVNQGGLGLGFAAGLVTLWATFAPCFLWIFAGAPYIEWIAAQPRLSGALTAISAAVVGVILNLSIWFALHVFFAKVVQKTAGPMVLWVPDVSTLDWRVPVLALVCAALLLWQKIGMAAVLAIAAALGWLLTVLF